MDSSKREEFTEEFLGKRAVSKVWMPTGEAFKGGAAVQAQVSEVGEEAEEGVQVVVIHLPTFANAEDGGAGKGTAQLGQLDGLDGSGWPELLGSLPHCCVPALVNHVEGGVVICPHHDSDASENINGKVLH